MRIDCNVTENFIKEMHRMCDYFFNDGKRCYNCPLFTSKMGKNCKRYIECNPQEAITIVQKWSDEHPRKTYLEDFTEKFPKAPTPVDNRPALCRCSIYGEIQGSKNCKFGCCTDCWDEPMPEVEG